ncbi:hypothetical protein QMO56_10900 [Roseomonas sp. E05]|uniref:hypothetical protein n=1 Tax=Roseomonas sp. E05 TaxID=3046310 RepID=UPI0024BA5742|nr:hypothetical protein [Roseomonas sp. E05]MDJ0388619.1 hypothetical protein [Roseomonas sp. E05]
MQHFRRFAATIVVGGLIGPGAVPAVAQALPPATEASGAEASANPYTQRGVPAEATAENAVIARTKAIASAQRLAYQRMAGDLGLPTGLSDSQIDQMVSSIIVEEERTSRTGYSGRLTVNFNPNRLPGAAGRSVAGAAGAMPVPGGDAAPPVMPSAAPAGYIEASARYAGLREWLELRRRLYSNPEIASVEIQAIAVDGARLRLGLRHGPEVAAQTLPSGGLAVFVPARAPAATPGRLAPPVPFGAAPPAAPQAGGGAGGPWQIGLAGRF